MPVESLLVCRDADALKVLRRVLDEIGIQLVISTTSAEASGILRRRKFDAVIIDCDDVTGASEVLQDLRHGTSNKAAIVFALIAGATSVRDAYDIGANFVLEKPLSPDRVQRSFRAAHGLMVRERRRYFRYEVEIPVTLEVDGNVVRASINNLSEGGLSVFSQRELPKTGGVRVNFTLPGTNTLIDGRGEVAWNTGDRAGIRLLFLSENVKAALTAWLAQAVEKQQPVAVTTGRGASTPGK